MPDGDSTVPANPNLLTHQVVFGSPTGLPLVAPNFGDQLVIDASFDVRFYINGDIKIIAGGLFEDLGISWLPNEWNDVTATVDHAAKTYDLSITNTAGTATALGLGFRNAAANSFKTLGLWHTGGGFTAYTDDIKATVILGNADFDGDGDKDGNDLLIWQRGFGLGGQTDNSNGDADGSGTVDGLDLDVWEGQFGTSITLGGASNVPEPSGLTLLSITALGLAGMVRRR
jgi:hypothetical protein